MGRLFLHEQLDGLKHAACLHACMLRFGECRDIGGMYTRSADV